MEVLVREKRDKASEVCSWVLLAVIFLSASYCGLYFALLRVERKGGDVDHGRAHYYREATYRIGGRWVSSLMSPIHALDVILWPSRWSPVEVPDSIYDKGRLLLERREFGNAP